MERFLLKELSRYKIGTYADIIYRNALLYPKELAFKCGSDGGVSFSEFNVRVNRLIHALTALGIKKGDVLGILSWNCLAYTEIYGAAMKGGFIASPFNARLQVEELDYLINYSDTRILFVGPELYDVVNSLRGRISKVKHFVSLGPAKDIISFEEMMFPQPEQEPDLQTDEEDPVFIFYTSGTTGVPRGALYTQARAIDDTRRFPAALCVEQGDKQVQIMPLFHVGGAKNLWGYFYAGASNIIMPQNSFDPKATLKTIQDEKATDIHIVPTHLAAFLDLPDVNSYDLGSLKRMFYAASPMPFELLKKGMEKFGPIFLQFYGATEDGPNVTFLSKRQHLAIDQDLEKQKVLRSAGFPHIGVHVRIVDEEDRDLPPEEVGEIIVHSKATMQEWWHKPDETAETIVNGWVHTGDMGKYDAQGYVYIVDRKKDMIVSGGENVFPREIEEVLYEHPSIKEAAVFGIPDPYWVEKVHAVVVLVEGGNATEREIIDFCKERLARYKAPKSVEFIKEIPKNSAGKILKKDIRAKYWDGLGRNI